MKSSRNAPFTVRHVLFECGDFAQVINNCFQVDNMKQLFQDINIDSIMTFFKRNTFFYQNLIAIVINVFCISQLCAIYSIIAP